MHPNAHDAAYLWDMLDAAKTVRELTKGIDFNQYLKDRKLQLAIERLIEIIGEAANKVSSIFQEAHSEIPWKRIIAQRNVLAHEYASIKQERLWIVATEKIIGLIDLLEPLIPPISPADS